MAPDDTTPDDTAQHNAPPHDPGRVSRRAGSGVVGRRHDGGQRLRSSTGRGGGGRCRGGSSWPAALGLLLLMSGGCGDSTTPGASDSESARAISPPRSEDGLAPVEPPADPPAHTPSPPRATHPIDHLPEGQIYRQALAALDAGDAATAERLRRQLADHPQYSVLSDAVAAVALAKQGASEPALEAAQRISTVPVMRAEAFMIAGEAFRTQGRWSHAIGAFQQALEAHPDHLRAHRWLGALYYDTGAMQLATHHLRRAAELDPDDYRSLRLAGLIHREYENYAEAVEDYEEALRRAPPETLAAEIRLELVEAFLELRRLDDARSLLAAVPESPESLTLRATMLETEGAVEEALAAASQAVEQQPDHPQANFILGRIHLSQRQWPQAIDHLRVVVEAKPTDHEPRFLLGRALLNAGHADAGGEQMERATELRTLFLELAELHQEAIERPADADVRFQLGQMAERLEWNGIARSWYRAAVGLDPGHAEAAAALEQLRDEPAPAESAPDEPAPDESAPDESAPDESAP